MKTMTVGEFKTHFSEVIEQVKKGEEIAVTYGKKKEIIGYFKPEIKMEKRPLGPLQHLGYYMADDFCETTDDEFPISDLPL
jgi:hypothetical protein